MKLANVLSNIKFQSKGKILEEDISGIACSLSKIQKGFLFILLKNNKQIKDEAISRGAVACLCEKMDSDTDVGVKDIRKTYALVSKNFYHSKCDKLKVIAVTGTNGKTTTTHIIANMLSLLGKKVGIIGTLGAGMFGHKQETGFTTPDPEILHDAFEKIYDSGAEYAVIEASAHAIELKKLCGIKFECVAFTNLTQDHLDFFGNMENYFEAKKKLFCKEYSKSAVVCVDDDYGKRLAKESEIFVKSFSLTSHNADVFIDDLKCDTDGSRFKMLETNMFCPLAGKFNVQNFVCATLILLQLGFSLSQITGVMGKVQEVEGRFNKIEFRGANIIVDFAHTPDGLEKILSAVKSMPYKRILCVFGCGGNRDKKKRPIMGSVAEKFADVVIVTSDNPRFEEPLDIIKDIEKGMLKEHFVYEDRSEAVAYAISILKKGDCLVIAGKGGEKEQIIGDEKIEYNDFEAIKVAIEKRIKKEKNNRNMG